MKKILWLDNNVPTAADWRLIGHGGMDIRHACHYITSHEGAWSAYEKDSPSYERDLEAARRYFAELKELGHEQVRSTP